MTGSRPTSSSPAWPATALDAAQRAFDLVTCPPAPLALDCRGIPGLPQRLLPLDELRRAMIRDSTPRASRDQVWRELVTRARRDGPGWVVAAVGVAMPGLRRRAGVLASGWRGETADLDAELLAGFLERLREHRRRGAEHLPAPDRRGRARRAPVPPPGAGRRDGQGRRVLVTAAGAAVGSPRLRPGPRRDRGGDRTGGGAADLGDPPGRRAPAHGRRSPGRLGDDRGVVAAPRRAAGRGRHPRRRPRRGRHRVSVLPPPAGLRCRTARGWVAQLADRDRPVGPHRVAMRGWNLGS